MDIGVPIKDLGPTISNPQRQDSWLPRGVWWGNQFRQLEYEVHQHTQSIVMVFTDGEGWPNIEVAKDQSAGTLLADEAVPLMHTILEDHYPPAARSSVPWLPDFEAGGIIKPHHDKHPSFHYGHRIHIPIVTNPRVRFMIDGRPQKMSIGEVYEINNQKKHSVMNKGSEGRINFIFDYIPPNKIRR